MIHGYTASRSSPRIPLHWLASPQAVGPDSGVAADKAGKRGAHPRPKRCEYGSRHRDGQDHGRAAGGRGNPPSAGCRRVAATPRAAASEALRCIEALAHCAHVDRVASDSYANRRSLDIGSGRRASRSRLSSARQRERNDSSREHPVDRGHPPLLSAGRSAGLRSPRLKLHQFPGRQIGGNMRANATHPALPTRITMRIWLYD